MWLFNHAEIVFQLDINSISVRDIFIADCATINTILQSLKYFSKWTKIKSHVLMITDTLNIIEYFGNVSFLETQIYIPNAFYSSLVGIF